MVLYICVLISVSLRYFYIADRTVCVRRNGIVWYKSATSKKCKCIVNNKYEYGQWSCSFKHYTSFFQQLKEYNLYIFRLDSWLREFFSLTAIFFRFFYSNFNFHLVFFRYEIVCSGENSSFFACVWKIMSWKKKLPIYRERKNSSNFSFGSLT